MERIVLMVAAATTFSGAAAAQERPTHGSEQAAEITVQSWEMIGEPAPRRQIIEYYKYLESWDEVERGWRDGIGDGIGRVAEQVLRPEPMERIHTMATRCA